MKWSEKEIEWLFMYIESDDSETMEEAFEFARYMLHNESGLEFPLRTLSSIRSKFYEVSKNKTLKAS